MITFAPLSAAAALAPARPEPGPAAEADPLVSRPAPARDHDAPGLPAYNDLMASCLAAFYDERVLHPDPTPRGVEIDRIEMIEQGFDHIRELFAAISAAAAEDLGPATDLRL
ncbi:hypothetical protein [Poseidonocella sp. HB161398]|uniref:hypothetical protein n=1 Tax=Poseidonocella sp. HB161398 TaxID=2320855 RepID=UPI0011082A34|nr:hypothetical protein [Poseidonocella sp. HB161398]